MQELTKAWLPPDPKKDKLAYDALYGEPVTTEKWQSEHPELTPLIQYALVNLPIEESNSSRKDVMLDPRTGGIIELHSGTVQMRLYGRENGEIGPAIYWDRANGTYRIISKNQVDTVMQHLANLHAAPRHDSP